MGRSLIARPLALEAMNLGSASQNSSNERVKEIRWETIPLRFDGDVRLSHPPTRGDAYQTLAEPVVLELVPVGWNWCRWGGDNEE